MREFTVRTLVCASWPSLGAAIFTRLSAFEMLCLDFCTTHATTLLTDADYVCLMDKFWLKIGA
eukprot:SAG31_NODE_244_length_19246_cov_20.233823_14_plen_63_part_00